MNLVKEKYISEAALKDEPKKNLSLKIKEGSITPEHLSQRVVDEVITPMIEDSVEEYKEIAETIAASGMTPEDKAKLDSLPTGTELEAEIQRVADSATKVSVAPNSLNSGRSIIIDGVTTPLISDSEPVGSSKAFQSPTWGAMLIALESLKGEYYPE